MLWKISRPTAFVAPADAPFLIIAKRALRLKSDYDTSVHQLQRNLLKKALADSGKLNCAASLVGWGGAVAVALSTIDVISYLAVNITLYS